MALARLLRRSTIGDPPSLDRLLAAPGITFTATLTGLTAAACPGCGDNHVAHAADAQAWAANHSRRCRPAKVVDVGRVRVGPLTPPGGLFLDFQGIGVDR